MKNKIITILIGTALAFVKNVQEAQDYIYQN